MLNFWKNAARGKSKFPTRPPESTKELESPSGSNKNDANILYQQFKLDHLEDDDQDICVSETSRLSKNLLDTLSDKKSLAYFVEYMESISSYPLIKFWSEVESFKTAVRFHCIYQTSYKTCCLPHETVSRTVSFDSSLHENSKYLANGSTCTDNVNNDDSECTTCCMKIDPADISNKNGVNELENKKNKLLDDAINIFKKFIALESPCKLDIPDDIRNSIISSICHPEGLIQPHIFKTAQEHVFSQLSSQYFDKYVQSDYHYKYQIDILTSGSLTIEDIIYNQMALFYFMEYLEQEQSSLLLEFIMAVINFKEQLKTNTNYNSEQAQNDAIILYDKYFSLQATSSLGLSSEVRFDVEQNICQDGGPSPDCFHKPFRIILKVLRQYITTFLTSQLYYKYLSEMISSVQGNWQSTKKHKKSASDCSSEISASTRNTLLAMGDLPKSNSGSSTMRIDSKHLYSGELLWRRKTEKGLCLGRVNSLGRFESCMEPDPEKRDPSVIKRVVNKLVHGEKDKAKEELAWQVAHMIVKDITDVTMGIPEGQL